MISQVAEKVDDRHAQRRVDHRHRFVQVLWGSDWPHTELWDFMQDEADLIDLAMAAVADTTLAQKLFVMNTETLSFGR